MAGCLLETVFATNRTVYRELLLQLLDRPTMKTYTHNSHSHDAQSDDNDDATYNNDDKTPVRVRPVISGLIESGTTSIYA